MPRAKKKVVEEVVEDVVREAVKPRLKAFSNLIGRMNTDSIHAIYGPSQAGKTTLVLQLLYDISDQLNRPVLIYDCEGGANEFVRKWGAKFGKQYPKARVDVRKRRDFRAILLDHGKVVKVKYSGGDAKSDSAKRNTSGKLGVTIVDEKFPSPIAQLVEKKNYCLVFYDSITMPMQFFGSEQQNFPARASVQALWFNEMINLIDEQEVYVIASHHQSKNPADPRARVHMSGGKSVHHASKVIFYLKQWEAKGIQNYRTLILARYFDAAPNSRSAIIELTNNGYEDRTEEEMENSRVIKRK